MSIIDTLITDRTQADAAQAAQYNRRGYANLTEDEKAEWDAGLKGAYNATDLNRVGEACEYIYGIISDAGNVINGYEPLRTDWTISEIPTASEMDQYIATVRLLKQAVSATQELPSTMDEITFDGANNIEKLLAECDKLLSAMQASYFYSAEIYSAEV